MIRRRVRAGAHQTDLAREHGVNRKTIRRRLNALESADAEQERQLAQRRLRRQAGREKRKLRERDRAIGLQATENELPDPRPMQDSRPSNRYFEWLDTPKNLSGRALAEARGLVRIRNLDGTIRTWVEREEVEERFDAGWLLDD